jgi:hypothetical protein
MGRDEKPSSTLQKRLISYTLKFSFGYTTYNIEIKLVIYRFHSADFTLNVGSPRTLGGGPHHMQGCHTRGLWIGLKRE